MSRSLAFPPRGQKLMSARSALLNGSLLLLKKLSTWRIAGRLTVRNYLPFLLFSLSLLQMVPRGAESVEGGRHAAKDTA